MTAGAHRIASAALAACLAAAMARPGACAGLPKPPSARTPVRLDALGAVRYALAHAPALLEQRATVANLDATFDKQRAAEYPAVTGQLQNQIAKQSNASGGLAQFGVAPTTNFSQNTAQIFSSYNVYNGTGPLFAQQAKRNVEKATFDLHAQEEQTAVDVSNAFYALAAKRQAVVVADRDLAYERELLDAARASERVGRVAGVDVLRAQVAVAKSQSSLVAARADEANAREALAVRIGAPADSTFDVPDVLPQPALPQNPVEQLTSVAQNARPEIASAHASFDAALLGDATVDADLRPTVQLTGAFGSQVSPTSFVLEQQQIDQANAAALAQYELEKTLFPGGNIPPPVILPNVNRNRPGFWSFGITSTFQLPAIDYGQRAANHHASKALIDAAAEALFNAYDSVAADVRAAARNAAASAEQLRLAEQSAELARESARIAQLQYRNGLISFTDANQTEQTAVAAENDLVGARVAYLTGLIKLRVSLGPPDPVSAADLRGL